MKYLLLSVLATSIVGSAENPTLLGNVGDVMGVNTGDNERDTEFNNKLHFCIIDNGVDDYIYAGTKYGMWSSGEFDVSFKGTVVKTIKIDGLLYNGIIIKVGDLIKEKPNGNWDWYITRVTGDFK